MFALRLKKVGGSVGFVLPKEMLRHLHAKAGQTLFAIETPTGYTITTLNPELQKQLEAGEALLNRYGDVFKSLAK